MVKSLTKMDKAGLYCTVIAAAFLTIWSIFSIISGLFSENILDLIIGVLFITIGCITGYYGIRFYRKVLYFNELLDSAFENGIYQRLEPLVDVISEARVDIAGFSRDLKLVLLKVEDLETELNKYREAEPSAMPGNHTSNFIIKSIFLLVITLSIFIFIIEFPVLMTPYLLPVIYFTWWFFITAEFKMFNKEDAWWLGLAPIIIIPVISLFIGALLDSFSAVGVMSLGLVIYTSGYYIWASYRTTGKLPFNIHHELKEALVELSKRDKD